MKKYQVCSYWFGEPEVVIRGDAATPGEPVPCIGQEVLLTGGVRVIVEHVGKISYVRDSVKRKFEWIAPLRVKIASAAGASH